jgi:enterochelin esterase family protein
MAAIMGWLLIPTGHTPRPTSGTPHRVRPVVRFVNRYRERPRRVADRLFVSCGIDEPLITPNRSMVHTFESTGMAVRFLETRDALSWVFPGPQKLVYE